MKTSGSYASLLRGVSQQAPEVRVSGQHAEQINLVSDPVAGLSRRRGTVMTAQTRLAAMTDSDTVLAAAAQGYRVLEHTTEGTDYWVLLREYNTDAAWIDGKGLPPAIVYNRNTKAFIPLATDGATVAALQSLARTGISAAVSLGRIIAVALKGVAVGSSGTDVWGPATAARLVVWIRGGAYTRTYKIVLADSTVISYTTPDAGAAGAAEAISPQNIATQLKNAAVAAGFATAYTNGAHLAIDAAQEGVVSDGGDGALIRGVFKTTDSVDKLPLMAENGHVVKVQTGPDSYFFVKAVTKTGTNGTLQEVLWQETAGYIQGQSITSFYVGVVEGGTFRFASSPATLAGTNIPQFIASTAGDQTNNPAPAFLAGRPITYLGLFQDRLLVGAGAALAISAAGDYFNFFRSTIVTVPLKDPFEQIAQGGEDDVLRHSDTYSRNLIIFGDKRQYSISGTTALTPTSPNMSIMTTYAGAAEVAPVAAGGLLYYARNREGNVALHQIQPGSFVDSAESFPASAQISDYIMAPAAQLANVPGAPALMLVRSRSAPRSIYVFSYLDQPDGRKQEAWYKWEFNALNGELVGMLPVPDGILLMWLRITSKGRHLVVDTLPLASTGNVNPYFDSVRPWADIATLDLEITQSTLGWVGAFRMPSERFLLGGEFVDVPSYLTQFPAESAHMMAGIPYDSEVTLTNPFIRDGQGLAVLTGRTVISKYSVNMRDSSGVAVKIVSGGVTTEWSFNARVLGDLLNQIGTIPVTSTIVPVPVGRETRAFSCTLGSLKWYPFNLIGIEWTGQAFNRTPRA